MVVARIRPFTCPCAAQARLQEATRQLSGGGDGAPSYKELKQKLAAAEDRLQEALRSDEEQSAKVCGDQNHGWTGQHATSGLAKELVTGEDDVAFHFVSCWVDTSKGLILVPAHELVQATCCLSSYDQLALMSAYGIPF